jgi:hypothetical protein
MKDKIINIEKAKYINDYKIKFQFNDKTEKIVDFNVFLSTSKNPMTRKYLNENYFKKYKLSYGDIIWGDYEICFPIWDIYSGSI